MMVKERSRRDERLSQSLSIKIFGSREDVW